MLNFTPNRNDRNAGHISNDAADHRRAAVRENTGPVRRRAISVLAHRENFAAGHDEELHTRQYGPDVQSDLRARVADNSDGSSV